jgi:hypothetical protein
VETKLDGKGTYRTWSIQIEAIAQATEPIWAIIKEGIASPHQQYARSLLLLNLVPTLQMEVRDKTTANEIWTYLKEQFDTNDYADLATAVRRLRNIQWDSSEERTIEGFYQELKTCQMVIKEVSSRGIPDLVLTSLLLCAIERQYRDFVTNTEAQLSNPTTPSNQKTFEYTFGRFRTEYYRRRARQEEEDQEDQMAGVHAVSMERCVVCDRLHGRGCWVVNPELAPSDKQGYYKRKHDEWKAKTKTEELTIR